MQDGKVIQNSRTAIPGIAEKFCEESKKAFGDAFKDKGGFSGLGKALDRGVVLVPSLRDDHAPNMLWYPMFNIVVYLDSCR
jgi:cellulose 1,4-beta-cellobiosidase